METNIKELKEELGKVHKQCTDRREQGETESAETTASIEKMNGRFDELGDLIKAVETKVSRAELDLSDLSGVGFDDEKVKLERKAAFDKALRKGINKLNDREFAVMYPENRKVLVSKDDTTGGFLGVPELEREIIKDIILMSPVRQLARVRTTGSRSVQIPIRTGTFAATWTEENETQTEATGLTYGLKDVFARQLTAFVDISKEDLEDAEFDLEAELRLEFAEQFAVAEGTAFVLGTGQGRPEGFMINSSVGEVNGGHASLLQADGIIDLWSGLKTEYARNATFVLRRATIGEVRKLKDGQGQYLWQPDFTQRSQARLLGFPWVEMPDMAEIAAAALAILFGNLAEGYQPVDMGGMRMIRDDVTTKGRVKFYTTKYVGGDVVNFEAIKLQKISA